MEHSDKNNNTISNDNNPENNETVKGEQQQTDPQITEWKGFADKKEDLEPILEDGTKSPDKAPPPNVNE